MPRGSAVIRYAGKRGVVWRIKYADATGRQVQETVGAEADGVTRKVAEAALRDRLVKVEGRGWRKPAPTTFREYAAAWMVRCEAKRGWKPGTVTATRTRLDHLNEVFGPRPLGSIRPRDVAAYVDEGLGTFSAKTISHSPQPAPRRAQGCRRRGADPIEPCDRRRAAEDQAEPMADPPTRGGTRGL